MSQASAAAFLDIAPLNSILEASVLPKIYAATAALSGGSSSPGLSLNVSSHQLNPFLHNDSSCDDVIVTSPTHSDRDSKSESDSTSESVSALLLPDCQPADNLSQYHVSTFKDMTDNSNPPQLAHPLAAAPATAHDMRVQTRSSAAKATGLQPMQKPPKGNSVKQYHKLSSMQGVVFYQQLQVTDEYGHQHCFELQDDTQGALVSKLALRLIT